MKHLTLLLTTLLAAAHTLAASPIAQDSVTTVTLVDTPTRHVVCDCQPLGCKPAEFARIAAQIEP